MVTGGVGLVWVVGGLLGGEDGSFQGGDGGLL